MAVETLRRVVGYVSRDAKRHLVKDVRTLYAWLAEEGSRRARTGGRRGLMTLSTSRR